MWDLMKLIKAKSTNKVTKTSLEIKKDWSEVHRLNQRDVQRQSADVQRNTSVF